jgi:hypothetical protein
MNLKNGMMEHWNDGVMGNQQDLSLNLFKPIIPVFQHSNIPVG